MNDDEFHDYRDDYHDYSQLADASGAADYSHPADHSAGSGKPSAPDMNPVNKYLQGREQAGAQSGLNKMGGGNVAKAENSGGSANPMNFSPGQSSGGRFDMKANVKKRIIGWLFAGLLGVGGAGFGLFANSLLFNSLDAIANQHYGYSQTSRSHVIRNIVKCQLRKKCYAATTADDKGHASEDEKIGNIPKGEKDAIEKNGGLIVEDADGNRSIIPDGHGVVDAYNEKHPGQKIVIDEHGKLTFDANPGANGGKGKPKAYGSLSDFLNAPENAAVDKDFTQLAVDNHMMVTGDNVETLVQTNPKLAGDLADAANGLNPDMSVSGGDAAAKVERMDGIDEANHLSDDLGEDKNGNEELVDQEIAESDKDGNTADADKNAANSPEAELATIVNPEDNQSGKVTAANPPSDPDANDATTSGETSTGGIKNQTSKPTVGDNEANVSSARNAIEKFNAKFSGTGAQIIQTALGFVCAANDGVRGFKMAVKIVQYSYLIKYASTVIKIGEMIRAQGDGKTNVAPQIVSQMGQLITAVMRDSKGRVTKKSGTDSFGWQLMSGALSPMGNFSTSPGKNDDTAKPGVASTFTSSVIANGNASGNSGGKSVNIAGGITHLLSGSQFDVGKDSCDAVNATLNAVILAQNAAEGGNLLECIGAIASAGTFVPGTAACTSIVVDLGSQALSAVVGGLANITSGGVSTWLNESAVVINGAGQCTSAVIGPTSGLATKFAQCASAVLGIAIGSFMNFAVPAIIKAFTKGFLQSPMPVGEDMVDAVASGAGAWQGQLAGMSGNAPLSNSQAMAYLNQMSKYNMEQNRIAQVTDPWDVYNTRTAVGSFVGSFVSSVYSNGNSPLGMLQSLVGMFAGTLGKFANTVMLQNPSYAAAANANYLSACKDTDMSAGGKIAVDPFCNPIYGLPDGTGDDNGVPGTDSASAAVNNPGNKNYIVDAQTALHTVAEAGANDPSNPDCGEFSNTFGLCTGVSVGGVKAGDFINECITRNKGDKMTPMGMASDTDKSVLGFFADPLSTLLSKDTGLKDGSDCTPDANDANAVLYSYINYWQAQSGNIKGDEHGCQAAGSCDGGSSAQSSAGGSSTIASLADANAVQDAFASTGGSYGGYTVGYNGCTTVSAWFIGAMTDGLTYGHGNGFEVVGNMVSRNPSKGLVVSNTPTAGSLFSVAPGVAAWGGTGDEYGHTGVVLSVSGNTATVLESGSSFANKPKLSWIDHYTFPQQGVTFVDVSKYLKNK